MVLEELLPTARAKIARRHRRIALTLLVAIAGHLIIAFVMIFARVAPNVDQGGSIRVLLSLGLAAMVVTFGTYLILAWFGINFASSLSGGNASYRIMLILESCIPILQLIVVFFICGALARQWRALGVRASWRGPTRDALTWLGEKGHCLACGYNLRSNESGFCPECGSNLRKKLHD